MKFTRRVGRAIKNIKILNLYYTIEETDLMRVNSRWAEVDFPNQKIRIDNNISAEQHDMRLIHEIIHAILEQNGITWQNESVIQTIACGLYNAFRENPGMFKAFSFETKRLQPQT